MNKFKLLWSNLSGSFWFVPTLIVMGSLALAVGFIELDTGVTREWAARWPRLFGAGAAGARGMLSTIAGSMMTVVGVTFSMILVTLALASSQYTSRILRTFMKDRVTQVVMGVFAGIFTYCLVALRTIRGGDEGEFVPSLTVALAVVLAIGGIGVFIFFIHHIASSIQASLIIAAVTDETLLAVDRLFPEVLGEGGPQAKNQSLLPLSDRNWQAVHCLKMGYIQNVGNAALLKIAREQKTIVRVECRIGEFVTRDTSLASIAANEPPKEEIIAALQGAFSVNRYRTVDQDVGFGIRQLVDIALRALSPGINDTTTAVMCLDYLMAVVARLATRDFPSAYRYEEGELRVIAKGPDFSYLVGEAFDQIRDNASDNLTILLRILEALHSIADLTSSASRREVLREQMRAVAEIGERTINSPRDRAKFQNELGRVRAELEGE